MLLVQKAEYEWPSPLGPRFKPEHPVTKLEGDHDVFGDGSVVIISTPGHTPGHQCLLVKLPKTGAVLLSGDAVHFKDNWENRRVPEEQRQQGQDGRLDAANGRGDGEGKGAALDQSRQGAARRTENVARILRLRLHVFGASAALVARSLARIGNRRGTGGERLSQPRPITMVVPLSGRRHRRSSVPLRRRQGEQHPRPAGRGREPAGRRRRTRRHRGRCCARRPTATRFCARRSSPSASPIWSLPRRRSIRARIEPISVLATYPLILIARADLPFDDLPELIAYARANPGKINYGTSGQGQYRTSAWRAVDAQGQVPHDGNSLSRQRAGHQRSARRQHRLVPDYLLANKANIDAGKLKLLATGSRERLKDYPQASRPWRRPCQASSPIPGWRWRRRPARRRDHQKSIATRSDRASGSRIAGAHPRAGGRAARQHAGRDAWHDPARAWRPGGR